MDEEDAHFPSWDGVVSRVTYPNFLGRPRPSTSPNPSMAFTEPNELSLRFISSTVIAGVSPEMITLFMIVSSAIT